MTTPDMSSRTTGILFAIAAYALFSTHDAFIKALGGTYAPFQVIFFSVLFGFPPVAMSMSAERALDNFRPHHPWWLAARTIGILISMVCGFYAFSVLPLAQVYAILFASPLLITALSVPFLGETVGIRRWIAIIVGLVGVMVVVRPGMQELTLGHLAALTAAVINSFGAIIVRKISSDERSAVLILYPMAATLLVMAVLLPGVYRPMPILDLGLAAMIGVLAFCGQFMSIMAYKRASAGLIAPMQYSQILWATLFGALFFNEFPDQFTFIGAGIIIASGVYIVWRETRESVSVRQPVLRMSNTRYDTGPSPDPKGSKRQGIVLNFDAEPATEDTGAITPEKP